MTEPKILIHACNRRIEYVIGFLEPRLKDQGFKNIEVFLDSENKGCLASYIESYKKLPRKGHTWHLQDDVLPDRRFYQWACESESFDGIICGFGNKWFYNKEMFGEAHNQHEMFYSFPCIRIPNIICHEWLEWFERVKDEVPEIASRLSENKYVDYFFKLFIGSNPGKIPILNFKPCIVEHIDDYIGHSVVNAARVMPARALIFEDDESLEEFKKWTRINFPDYEV